MRNRAFETFKPIINGDWGPKLSPMLLAPYMDGVLDRLTHRYKKERIDVFPHFFDLFKGLNRCASSELKVVIVTLVPYAHTMGNGIGLGVYDDYERMQWSRFPPELEAIADCVERTVYNGFNLAFDFSLESWARQGVLCLNASLTNDTRDRNMHLLLWQGFTEWLLQYLDRHYNGIYFCFWGGHSKHYRQFCVNPRNTTLIADSPREGWNVNHFNIINQRHSIVW